jgi:hypothetical protein
MPSLQVNLNIGLHHSQCKRTRRHSMNKSPRGNHCSLVGRSRPAPCQPSTPCTLRPRWRLRSARSSKHRTMGPPRMKRENRHRRTCSFWIEQAPLCRACKPCSLPIALSPASQHRKLCSWLQLAPRQLRFPPSTQCSRPSPPWVRTSRPCLIARSIGVCWFISFTGQAVCVQSSRRVRISRKENTTVGGKHDHIVRIERAHQSQLMSGSSSPFGRTYQYSQLDMLNTKVPLGQVVHSVRSAELNFPASHSSQSSAASWIVASVMARSPLDLPALHRTHAVSPRNTPILPVGHTVHELEPGAVA